MLSDNKAGVVASAKSEFKESVPDFRLQIKLSEKLFNKSDNNDIVFVAININTKDSKKINYI